MEAKLNMETQFSKEDHDYALTHVHSKDKKGFFSMFVVMLGFGDITYHRKFQRYGRSRMPLNADTGFVYIVIPLFGHRER